MDFSSLPFFNSLVGRMRFLSAKSSVIAQNIANADTPHYRAQTLKAPDFGAEVSRTAMRTSHHRHRVQTGNADMTGRMHDQDGPAGINGNSVSLEQETMQLNRTRMEYGLATSVYRKGTELVRRAIRTDR